MSIALLPSTKIARSKLFEEVFKTMPRPAEETVEIPPSGSRFVVVSQDSSGLGFAKFLHNPPESEAILAIRPKEDEEEVRKLMKCGTGIVQVMDFDDLWSIRKQYKDYFWIWDGNHNWEEADQLRKEGFNVLGGQELTYNMEKDRKFGLELIERAGLS